MHRVSAKEARRSKRGSSAVLEFSYGGLLDDEPDTPKGRTSRDRYYYEPVFAVSASQIGKLSGMHAQEDMIKWVKSANRNDATAMALKLEARLPCARDGASWVPPADVCSTCL